MTWSPENHWPSSGSTYRSASRVWSNSAELRPIPSASQRRVHTKNRNKSKSSTTRCFFPATCTRSRAFFSSSISPFRFSQRLLCATLQERLLFRGGGSGRAPLNFEPALAAPESPFFCQAVRRCQWAYDGPAVDWKKVIVRDARGASILFSFFFLGFLFSRVFLRFHRDTSSSF